MEEKGPEGLLRRELGLVAGAAVVVNAMIGTGIFKKPAQIARLTGSLEISMLVWLLGGAIALAGAIAYAELSAAMPRTGGLYEYLRRAYGPTPAFLLGWSRLVLLIPNALGSFAKLGAEAFVALVGLPSEERVLGPIAAAIIGICAAINLFGVRLSTLQQAVLTGAKYVGVLALALVGLTFAFVPPEVASLPPPPGPVASGPTFLGVFASLVAVMWAYDGWCDLSSVAGEVHAPARTLPRALLAGTIATTVLYLLVNAAYARVLGLVGLVHSGVGEHVAAASLARATLGVHGLRAFSGLVFLSCFGASLSTLLTGPRVLVAMAADGVFFEALGRVSPRTGVPAVAVVSSAAIGALAVFFESFEQLTDGFVVGLFPFYALGVIAIFVLRRREPELSRPFRVPLHPLPELVFLVGAGCLLIGALRNTDAKTWAALGVAALGIPIERIFRRLRGR